MAAKTGGGGAPWLAIESPKPPRVPDHYRYWTKPPPEPSARLRYWMRQIDRGWRPNRRLLSESYDTSAQWYGVWMWEYLHIIFNELGGYAGSAPHKKALAEEDALREAMGPRWSREALIAED